MGDYWAAECLEEEIWEVGIWEVKNLEGEIWEVGIAEVENMEAEIWEVGTGEVKEMGEGEAMEDFVAMEEAEWEVERGAPGSGLDSLLELP